MWPFPPLSHNVLAITCTPQELTCSLIRKTKIPTRYELYAHYQYPISHHEYGQSGINNPTLLRRYIEQVIETHQLAGSSCVVSLVGPAITERITSFNQTDPPYHQIADPRLKGTLWDLYYLYPEDDGRFTFYVTGVKQTLIFQWKLLFSTLSVHLVGITTESMALLYAYKYVYGATFRPTQLARDLNKLHHASSLHGLLSHECIRRSLAIHTTLAPTLYTCVSVHTALGLFLLGSTAYETD